MWVTQPQVQHNMHPTRRCQLLGRKLERVSRKTRQGDSGVEGEMILFYFLKVIRKIGCHRLDVMCVYVVSIRYLFVVITVFICVMTI